ncbi:unnamed protein product [Dibothriocephalus latus]|uniref:Uncharacterized protein n=1 Tax=Dibothriocephalus latus TaxID=60516 RepID=A0A3P7KW92_DIBLA|nr:unnamed protein product [Dibothriocephalus latus]
MEDIAKMGRPNNKPAQDKITASSQLFVDNTFVANKRNRLLASEKQLAAWPLAEDVRTKASNNASLIIVCHSRITLRHRSEYRPNTSSTAYSNFCRFVIPQPASLASNSQAPSQSSASSSRNCSLEPSLPIRQLCPTDSPARLSFSQTFDLNVNVFEANINMHNASPVVEEEACTDVDIALFSSLGSEGGVSMNSICLKSMVSVSSPEEMRLHGPLPVRSTKDPRASSKVRKLRFPRKKRAHWCLQQANLKKSTIGVTAPYQGDAISIPIWGDDIYRRRSTLSGIYRILRQFYCLRPPKPG